MLETSSFPGEIEQLLYHTLPWYTVTTNHNIPGRVSASLISELTNVVMSRIIEVVQTRGDADINIVLSSMTTAQRFSFPVIAIYCDTMSLSSLTSLAPTSKQDKVIDINQMKRNLGVSYITEPLAHKHHIR